MSEPGETMMQEVDYDGTDNENAEDDNGDADNDDDDVLLLMIDDDDAGGGGGGEHAEKNKWSGFSRVVCCIDTEECHVVQSCTLMPVYVAPHTHHGPSRDRTVPSCENEITCLT